MSKIRVYELAQKMGIENKELMAKLKAVGVDVKSHTATVDEADVKKLAIPDPPAKTDNPPIVKEVSKEEVRVTTNVIRRRAKVVESVVEAEQAPAAEIKESPPEPKVKPAQPEEVKIPEVVVGVPPVMTEAAKIVPPEAPKVQRPQSQRGRGF